MMARQKHKDQCSGTSTLLLLLVVAAQMLAQTSALYHTSSEMLHWFSRCAAKRPEMLRFRELHEPHTDTVLPVATFSQGINSPKQKPKPAVLFVFGEHARELITPEVGIWLARMLLNTNSSVYDWPELSAAFQRAGIDADGRSLNGSSRATATGGRGSSSKGTGGAGGAAPAGAGVTEERGQQGSKQQREEDWPAIARGWVRQLLKQFEVVIVPIEALDSRRLVESGQLCVRKSASNVDLNRNWPFAWKKEAATDEQYGGPNPLSEPQSRLMKHLIDHLTGRLLGYVNVHSGEWALYTPWDSKQAYGPGLPSDLPDLVSKVGRLCDCKAGPAGAVSGYLAYGSSMDYLYVHKRVPYPLTVEVYGGDNMGKLTAGESNKELTAWPTVNKAGAPIAASAEFQRRRTLLQQQQHLLEQEQEQASWGGAVHLHGLSTWLRGLLQEQAPQDVAGGLEEQQQEQQPPRRRRRRRRRKQSARMQRVKAFAAAAEAEGSTQLPLLPNVEEDAAGGGPALLSEAPGQQEPSAAGVGAAGGGFSAGGDLNQLRQQAKQQLLQQQQHQRPASALSIPSTAAAAAAVKAGRAQPSSTAAAAGSAASGKGSGRDAIMTTVEAADPMGQSCFKAFNPETEAEYRRVVADWLAASLIMLKHMAEGKEGQRMVARVAAASPGAFSSRHSGISIHEPTLPPNASGTRDLLGGQC